VNGSDEDGETGGAGGKRKRPEDDAWLQEKRRKAGLKSKPVKEVVQSESEDADGDDEDAMENPFSDDEVESDDFDDMDSGDEDDDEPTPPKKERENPYVAPMPKNAAPVGKYIPPSLRKPAASDEEALKQLRRQLQGLLNRLSEANLLSILQSVEEVYQKSARQHVTSTMVDLLVSRASDPSILNETFLILHAGFATALFKVVGTDFGAQILEQIIIGIDRSRVEDAGEGKATLNLIGFLSYLYTFQLTGSAIMFDYIRIFLEGLSENNTELLLRMIRTSGQQLRSEDPSALKDIVLLLQRSVAQIGEDWRFRITSVIGAYNPYEEDSRHAQQPNDQSHRALAHFSRRHP
jgi:nucleolar MIF4G domain-containing protein 1